YLAFSDAAANAERRIVKNSRRNAPWHRSPVYHSSGHKHPLTRQVDDPIPQKGIPMRFWSLLLTAAGGLGIAPDVNAAEPAATPVQTDMLKHLDTIREELVSVNQDIWAYAELGLEEHRSAARLVGVLKKGGFKVKEGLSGMPTAFVAEYG